MRLRVIDAQAPLPRQPGLNEERDAQIARMKRLGHSDATIAKAMGLCRYAVQGRLRKMRGRRRRR